MPRSTAFAIAVLALSACAPAEPMHDPAADLAAIAAVRDGYAAAFKAGDAARVASYLTADANDMENGIETMVGAAAVEAGLKGMMAEMASQDIVITSQKTDVEGDLAYDRGTFRTTMMAKAGGDPVIDEGRYLVVLRRQADSSWKLVELIGNTTKPMMPTPARR